MSSSGLPSETSFNFLCSLSRAALSASQIASISERNFAETNWQEVLRLAEHHGVLSILARNLIDNAKGLAPHIERALSEARRLHLLRGLWFSSELARIVQHFDSAGIPVLPFKGAVLGHSAYGDPGLRSFSDLDFLISPANVEHAKRALAEIGYMPSKEFTPAVDRFWLRNGYEQSFDGPAGKHLVELQWALLPRFYAVDLSIDVLLAGAGNIVIGETQMRCLSPEDSVLALSLHAAKHLWGRLIWLVDIAETMRTKVINYRLLRSNARTQGVARMLAVTFWLAQNLLDAELSSVAQEMIAQDSQVADLGALFAARLARASTYGFASTEYFKLILKLRERPADRLR